MAELVICLDLDKSVKNHRNKQNETFVCLDQKKKMAIYKITYTFLNLTSLPTICNCLFTLHLSVS